MAGDFLHVDRTWERVKDDKFDGEDSKDEAMEEGDDAQDQFLNTEVQVEFEARNPEDLDFHGIRKLLGQLFLKANVNISDLADTIISQNYIGSVIKQVPVDDEEESDEDMDEDQDVFGVFTVLNFTHRKSLECMQQVKSLLLDRCQKCAADKHAQLSTALGGDSPIGLLISERFVNIPPQIALPSYESLWKEVDRAKKKNMPYTFTHFMLISKSYRLSHVPRGKPNLPMFTNAEDEFFAQHAELRFDFSVAGDHDTVVEGPWEDGAEEMEPLRTVMIIPAHVIPAIMDTMRTALAT